MIPQVAASDITSPAAPGRWRLVILDAATPGKLWITGAANYYPTVLSWRSATGLQEVIVQVRDGKCGDEILPAYDERLMLEAWGAIGNVTDAVLTFYPGRYNPGSVRAVDATIEVAVFGSKAGACDIAALVSSS
jgi:hypothetical protein